MIWFIDGSPYPGVNRMLSPEATMVRPTTKPATARKMTFRLSLLLARFVASDELKRLLSMFKF